MRLLLLALFALALPGLARAAALSHSGYLLDATDAAVSGPVTLVFRISDAPTTSGETVLWTASCPVTATGGYYAVVLGSGGCGPDLPSTVTASSATRYLEVQVGTAVLAPRQLLAPAPTAGYAEVANSLGAAALATLVTRVDLGVPLPTTGTASNATFLRGDGAWVTPPTNTGPAGAPGSTWRTGAGTPSNALGIDGDYYLDTNAPNTYSQRVSGAWVALGTLRGATGAQGPAGPGGSLATVVTAVDTTLAVNTAYVVTMAGATRQNLTFPATAAIGDRVEIIGNGSARFTLKTNAAAASQQLKRRNAVSAVSSSSSIAVFTSTHANSVLRLVFVGNGEWVGDTTDPALFEGTGGSVTDVGGFRIHTFTSSSTFTVTAPGAVEVLVVAGGGGASGGTGSGGGGAGGLVYSASHLLTASTYAVTVGAGGAASAPSGVGNKGGDSIFDNLVANGGGTSKSNAANFPALVIGGSGGGGGGASINGTYSAGGASNQGNVGGDGLGFGNAGGSSGTGGYYAGDGGGGAGGAGGPANGNRQGGIGKQYSISGTPTYYAGGGGGGIEAASAGGVGGLGGGGSQGGGSGVNGTGGGGGGCNEGPNIGGAGGSGIVIVRYPYTP